MAFVPSIPMSQIIASDAPLLSPISSHHEVAWENAPSPTDSFNYNYYSLPPSPHPIGSTRANSPIPTSCMLKMRMSPDATCESEQLCLPTSQVFDYPSSHCPSPSSSMKNSSLPTLTISGQALSKRSASPPPAGIKKARASGERIHSKDFIPPDVSGLSKREARLVKNRAAAFLSRQRKREEFELMEVYVIPFHPQRMYPDMHYVVLKARG